MSTTISIMIAVIAIIHIIEEYCFGWIMWANQFIPGITIVQFIVWNIAFLILCILGILINLAIFRLSIVALLGFNILVHLIPTILFRSYSPGLITALFLYIPVVLYSYYQFIHLKFRGIYTSTILGMIWMAIPFSYQLLRTHLKF